MHSILYAIAHLSIYTSVRLSITHTEHTDPDTGTESNPIPEDWIFSDPIKNLSSDPSTVSHLLICQLD